MWDFLPEAAAPFVVAAVRVPGSEGVSDGQAGRAVASREAVGRQLLSLIFGPQGDQHLPDVLAELTRDPDSRQALAELKHRAFEAFKADQAMASQAAAVIAAFYRQRADAGDVRALVELGEFLYWDKPEAARAAYQEAIDAGHLHALLGLARLLRNVLPEEETALALYRQAAANADADVSAEARYEIAFAEVPDRDAAPEFNPGNMVRTGLDVLEHGLPPLPAVLRHEMAIPVAYWKAEQCAVVLVLRFSRHGHHEPLPMAMQVSYSRGEGGRWQPPTHVLGCGFSLDAVRSPGSIRDLGGRPMVYGGGSFHAREATPGHPAVIATGRAAPEVTYLAVIKDGHEDRRPLESHFGAWVVCTEQPGSFDVAGLDANGAVLASLPHPFRAWPEANAAGGRRGGGA